MCEKCMAQRQENTDIKRAAIDQLFAPPTHGHKIPGFLNFLMLGRQLEAVCRNTDERLPGGIEPPEDVLMRAMITQLTPQERTEALRIAEYVSQHASALKDNLANAKFMLKDRDKNSIAVMIEGMAVVVYVNGEVAQRIELGADADPEAALDAAERAMLHHRELHERGEFGR